MFFQTVKVEWDEPLKGALKRQWEDLTKDIAECVQVRVPRHYLEGRTKEGSISRLYGFCDASTVAYAAVVYLVVQTSSTRMVTLLASKTRVNYRSKRFQDLSFFSSCITGEIDEHNTGNY